MSWRVSPAVVAQEWRVIEPAYEDGTGETQSNDASAAAAAASSMVLTDFDRRAVKVRP